MDYIDFKSSKKTILTQLLYSNNGVDVTNSGTLFDYFKYLHFVRHNFFHYLVLQMLNQPWNEEKPIQELVNVEMPLEYGRKTPDIFFETQKKIYLIDVSISIDIHKSEREKKTKIFHDCRMVDN